MGLVRSIYQGKEQESYLSVTKMMTTEEKERYKRSVVYVSICVVM